MNLNYGLQWINTERGVGSMDTIKIFWDMDRLSNTMSKQKKQNSKNGYEVYTPKITLDKTIFKTCDIKLLDEVFSKWRKPTHDPRSESKKKSL